MSFNPILPTTPISETNRLPLSTSLSLDTTDHASSNVQRNGACQVKLPEHEDQPNIPANPWIEGSSKISQKYSEIQPSVQKTDSSVENYVWFPIQSPTPPQLSFKGKRSKICDTEQCCVVDRMESATFSPPLGQYILGDVIGKGKYGSVRSAKMMYDVKTMTPSEPDPAFQYAVKSVINSNSAWIELEAYRHIERTLRVSTSTYHPGRYNNYMVQLHHGLSEPVLKRLNPFVAPLLGYSCMCVQASETVQITRHSTEPYVEDNVNIGNRLPRGALMCHMFLFYREPSGDMENLLLRWLKRPMTTMEAMFYIAEISEALLWLHEIGIVHQDIKLNNVLLQADGHIRITDLGLAHVIPGGPGSPYAGNIACTSHHMPPEIAGREPGTTPVWHAVDWFSVGVLLHRLLSNGAYPIVRTLKIGLSSSIKNISLNCQLFLCELLCPNPIDRLGSDLYFGGTDVLSHPGLITPLVSKPKTMSDAVGSRLPVGLRRAMVDHVKQATDLSDCPPFWINGFRDAIRGRSLIPPFNPLAAVNTRCGRASTEL